MEEMPAAEQGEQALQEVVTFHVVGTWALNPDSDLHLP